MAVVPTRPQKPRAALIATEPARPDGAITKSHRLLYVPGKEADWGIHDPVHPVSVPAGEHRTRTNLTGQPANMTETHGMKEEGTRR